MRAPRLLQSPTRRGPRLENGLQPLPGSPPLNLSASLQQYRLQPLPVLIIPRVVRIRGQRRTPQPWPDPGAARPQVLPRAGAERAMVERQPVRESGPGQSAPASGPPMARASCAGFCRSIRNSPGVGGGKGGSSCAWLSGPAGNSRTWRWSREWGTASKRRPWRRSGPPSTPRPCAAGGPWNARPCCPSDFLSGEADGVARRLRMCSL